MDRSESALLLLIKAGNEPAIESIYKLYREKFMAWAHARYKANPHDLEDVWQDAVIIFYENVKNGKLDVLNSKISTYLFAIGKNILHNKLKKNQRMEFPGSIDEDYNLVVDDLDFDLQAPENETYLKVCFEQLGRQCRDLLIKRYYLEHTIDEMLVEFNFNSKNVVSASLSRCLSQLRDFIKSRKKDTDHVG